MSLLPGEIALVQAGAAQEAAEAGQALCIGQQVALRIAGIGNDGRDAQVAPVPERLPVTVGPTSTPDQYLSRYHH